MSSWSIAAAGAVIFILLMPLAFTAAYIIVAVVERLSDVSIKCFRRIHRNKENRK